MLNLKWFLGGINDTNSSSNNFGLSIDDAFSVSNESGAFNQWSNGGRSIYDSMMALHKTGQKTVERKGLYELKLMSDLVVKNNYNNEAT